MSQIARTNLSKDPDALTGDDVTPTLEPVELLMLLLAIAGGTFAAAVVLPAWLPGLTQSLLGSQPKAYWYLARASGFVAYLVIWLSVALGLIISNKMARLWNGGPTAVDLHQFTTWLAVGLTVFHALILLGDNYIKSTPEQVLTPFGYVNYKPEWVGVGQIAVDHRARRLCRDGFGKPAGGLSRVGAGHLSPHHASHLPIGQGTGSGCGGSASTTRPRPSNAYRTSDSSCTRER